MSKPQVIIYSAMSETASGFSRFLQFEYKPRSDAGRRFKDYCRADPKFPRHITTRGLLELYLKANCATWSVRTAAFEAWGRYLAQQRRAAARATVERMAATA